MVEFFCRHKQANELGADTPHNVAVFPLWHRRSVVASAVACELLPSQQLPSHLRMMSPPIAGPFSLLRLRLNLRPYWLVGLLLGKGYREMASGYDETRAFA